VLVQNLIKHQIIQTWLAQNSDKTHTKGLSKLALPRYSGECALGFVQIKNWNQNSTKHKQVNNNSNNQNKLIKFEGIQSPSKLIEIKHLELKMFQKHTVYNFDSKMAKKSN